jgi:hypothetical protein
MNMYALGSQDQAALIDCNSPQLHTAMSGAITFSNESRQFALMSIYEQRLNRSIHKNLDTLRTLQAERKVIYEKDLAHEMIVAEANEINGLPYHPPARASQNGFVFSTSEVLAAVNRKTVLSAAAVVYNIPCKILFEGAYENFDPNRPNSGPNHRLDGLKAAAAA